MKSLHKIFVAALVASFLFFQAVPYAAANDEERTEKRNYGLALVDLVTTRPVGAGLTVLGFAAFVVSTPFTLFTDNTGDAWDKLVVFPAGYTFGRPLGDL